MFVAVKTATYSDRQPAEGAVTKLTSLKGDFSVESIFGSRACDFISGSRNVHLLN